MDLNEIPLDGKINWQEVKMYTNFLLDLTYNEIVQKYNKKEFFQKVFALYVDNDIVLLRDLIIEDFVPDKKTVHLSRTKKDKIIEFLAYSHNTSDLLGELRKIDPNLILPQAFDQTDYQQRAGRVLNGMLSIKTYIAENIASEYMPDINVFIKIDPHQLDQYLANIASISEKLAKEYDKLIETGEVDKEVLYEAINFIGLCGRTSITVNNLRDKMNLGNIAEIINKIERAINMVQHMRNKNISNPTADQIKSEIIDYLKKDIHL